MSNNYDQMLLKAKSAIDELDLSIIANAMILKQGWLKSEVADCSALYKNFLFLKYKYPNENLAPSEDIDEFWHNHILDTKKYRKDCEKIFGSCLDHYPYFGIDDSSTMEDLNASFRRTQELHKREFGYFICGVRYKGISRLIRRFLVG